MSQTSESHPSLQCRDVLLAEDDVFINEVVAKHLLESGYNLLSFRDGESLLRAAHERCPHVILLDMLLPIKNGEEVLRELKADPVLKMIPVIIFTNITDSAHRDKMLALGATEYLVKVNTSIEKIIETVRKVCSAKVDHLAV